MEISNTLAVVSTEEMQVAVPWMVGLMTVAVMVNQLAKVYDRFIKEQPTPSETYATKPDLRRLEVKVDKLEDEFVREMREMRKERTESVGKLHRRMDDLVGAVSNLKGVVDTALNHLKR